MECLSGRLDVFFFSSGRPPNIINEGGRNSVVPRASNLGFEIWGDGDKKETERPRLFAQAIVPTVEQKGVNFTVAASRNVSQGGGW